jgi:hypothetical protein
MIYLAGITHDELQKAIDLLIDSLITDGTRHKQWYTERVLEVLGVNLTKLKDDLNVDDYDWEPGIAP